MHLLGTLEEGIAKMVKLARVHLPTQSRHPTTLVDYSSALVQKQMPNPLVTDPEDTVY